MMKGFYTGAVTLIVVALIAVAAFGMVSTVKAREQNPAKAIADAKWQWQNARHLLGKSISDAMADNGYDNDNDGNPECLFNFTTIEATIGDGSSGYLYETLNDSLDNCTAQNISVDESGVNRIRVDFDLSCSKQIGAISIQYKKDGITFNKLAYYDSSAGCKVDVEDIDSGYCDVDTISGNPGQCGT